MKKQYRKEVVKIVVAFTNTNSGKIYIGIDDIDHPKIEGIYIY